MPRSTAIVLIGSAAMIATSAQGGIEVIYSEIAADASSAVPAGADVPKGTLFQAFDRPYRSADGTSWIMTADTDLATTEDEIIILGAGTAGATVVREGTAFGSPTLGELVGLLDRNLSLTNAGEYAFATNTDAAS